MLYQLVDWLATYAECAVILATVTAACGKKFTGRKNVFFTLALAGGNALLVALLNSITAFSFITPLFSIAYLFSVTRFLSNGNWILRVSASVIALFVILTVDYICFFALCPFCPGDIESNFQTFMAPGKMRVMYLALDKSADILIFFLIRKRLPQLSCLKKRWLSALLAASVAIYWIMQSLFNIILGGDYVQMQGAFIFFFFFLLCFLVVVLMLLISMASTESNRIENRLLQNTNQMMEENYQALHQDLQTNAKMIHDFHHHLRVIRGIAERENPEELLSYIDSILNASYREMDLCRSGSDVIDAVINCNAAEAERKGIPFHYDVTLHSPLGIDPVDICAVLANQIENALEACGKVPNADTRFVNVEITQHGGFVVFTVSNASLEPSLNKVGELVSRKERQGKSHGFGIKNIRDVTEKYNGHLTSKYADGVFTSTALLCISTI